MFVYEEKNERLIFDACLRLRLHAYTTRKIANQKCQENRPDSELC